MIVEDLLNLLLFPFKVLLEFIISLLPTSPSAGASLSNVIVFLRKGLWFFDYNFFCSMITVFIVFVTAQFVWAIIVWIYVKIPGIN